MPSSGGAPDPAPGLAPMTARDLDEVLEIERASFATPWRREHFEHELRSNPVAVNVVLRLDGRVVGYACTWRIAGELTINNIAIAPDRRGEGLGRRFLDDVLAAAREAGCVSATLEVRPSNRAARAMYERAGFRQTGRRPGYYASEGEDALILSRRL